MFMILVGHVYVPMEKPPDTQKLIATSRENTDYDTFGSIDSLIFEPKVSSNHLSSFNTWKLFT